MGTHQTYLLTLPSLMKFLGWHGGYLLVTIALFKYVFGEAANACPCVGHIPYGVAMFILPALSVWLVAFFVYYLRRDSETPWKTIKAYYQFRRPCARFATGENWELHSGLFENCHKCQRSWRSVKLCACAYASVIYPLLWLAFEFYHGSFYTCAKVGPDPNGILRYCDNWEGTTYVTYTKLFTLAGAEAVLVGNIFIVVDIVWIASLLIVYGVIQSKVSFYCIDSDNVSESNPSDARPPHEEEIYTEPWSRPASESRSSAHLQDTAKGAEELPRYQGLHQQRQNPGYLPASTQPRSVSLVSTGAPDPEGSRGGEDLPRYQTLHQQRQNSARLSASAQAQAVGQVNADNVNPEGGSLRQQRRTLGRGAGSAQSQAGARGRREPPHA